MDDIGKWNSYVQQQMQQVAPHERELMMTLHVPLVADQEVFRVGWDIKRPTGHRYVAISTGQAAWSRLYLNEAALHIFYLLDHCNSMLEPLQRDERG